MVSYVTNVITPFKLDPVSGKVVKRMPLITRDKGYAPSSDSKDLTISSDGRAYVLAGIVRVLFD